MPRVLTISRVTVAPENEPEYLRTVQALADLGQGRGQRLWVFRSAAGARTYLEFSESASLLSHRARASRTGEELRLETRLRELGQYAEDSWEVWEEVAPPAPKPSEGWSLEGEEEGGE